MTKNMVLRSPAALPKFFFINASVNPKYLGCHEKGPVLEIHLKKLCCRNIISKKFRSFDSI